MVFMKRRDEGHPLGALFVLSSMFAFAFVFHIVTQPSAELAVRFDLHWAALVAPSPASETTGTTGTTGATRTTGISGTAGNPGTAAAVVPVVPAVPVVPEVTAPRLLDALPWPPTTLVASVNAVASDAPTRDEGAVTRAIATAGSALRNALRKTF